MAKKAQVLQAKVIKFIKFFLVLFWVGILIYKLSIGDMSKMESVIVTLPMIFLTDIVKRATSLKLDASLEISFLFFLFISLFLGVNLSLYQSIWWLDKLSHLASGVLSAVMSVVILKSFALDQYNSQLFKVLFILSFTALIAVAWEVFEYIANIIIGSDIQNVITTGVNDTMQDLIFALAGAGLSLPFLVSFKKQNE